MIPGITEVHFPSYATLHEATASFANMGERTLQTQIRIDGDVAPIQLGETVNGVFYPMELTYKGERFALPTANPPALKDNSTRNALIDITFQSWGVDELKRYFYFRPESIDANTAVADTYQASVRMTLTEFVRDFGNVLKYYWPNDEITISLYSDPNPGVKYLIEIDKQKVWDVLTRFHEIFGVSWTFDINPTTGKYTIKVNYPTTSQDINDHVFQYGYNGGLMRFERQVPDESITNVLLGRGGEKNLPYRYFKSSIIESGTRWTGDPDALDLLSSVNFDRLRDATFRWYVRGYKRTYSRPTINNLYHQDTGLLAACQYAFDKGYADRGEHKFNPVEYVRDEDSIAAYGERWGYLENNDEIYPTIRGAANNVDKVIEVSKIQTDNIEDYSSKQAIKVSINPLLLTIKQETDTRHFTLKSEPFVVPEGMHCNITSVWYTKRHADSDYFVINTNTSHMSAVSAGGQGAEAATDPRTQTIDGLSAGTYSIEADINLVGDGALSGTFGLDSIAAVLVPDNVDEWKPTFDIWIPNVWSTRYRDTGYSDETYEEYAERVWRPILGDHLGKEAAIVFASGPLASSSDYEFVIASIPEYDDSKEYNGVRSHWKVTLYKSDAEYEATGLFLPHENLRPAPWNEYYFVGIDMPFQYVMWKEEDVTISKLVALSSLKEVYPTWVIGLDKVRVHTHEQADAQTLIADRLKTGIKLKVSDPRFAPTPFSLYVQSVTYNWREPTDKDPFLVPDIEVVLSDKVAPVTSSYSLLQGQVNAIQSEYVRASDVEDIVRRVAGEMFLKKTGEADTSASPTSFASRVSSPTFRAGGVGGTGWGIYRSNISPLSQGSPNIGDTVVEADILVARKELKVETLVVNQVTAVGGKEVLSAAKIQVTKVFADGGIYTCFFDQKQGSVDNLFVKGDIAMCQRFNSNWSTETNYYKMVVVGIGYDYIELSAATKDGSGTPAVGDIIVQYGHCAIDNVPANPARQSVIIRDVINGGYERMITGLTRQEVEPEEGEEEEEPTYEYTEGTEYFFAGRTSSKYNGRPGFFIGKKGTRVIPAEDPEDDPTIIDIGEYVEYDGQGLSIKGFAEVSNVSGSTLIDGSLIQTGEIMLGEKITSVQSPSVANTLRIYAGISGKYNEHIAAWYGGEKIDKEALSAAQLALDPRYARSLFRFDGSGYLAGGNIHWNSQGYGGIPGVTWRRNSTTQQDEIKIEGTVILGDSDNYVADIVKILSWFDEDANGNIYVKRKPVSGGDPVVRGFYNEGFISAGGIGSSGSGPSPTPGTAVQWGTYDSGYRELVVENDPDMSDISHRTVALSGHTHTASDITNLAQTIASALSGYVTTNDLNTALSGKENTIGPSHHIDYSYIDNTPNLGAAAFKGVDTALTGTLTNDNVPTSLAVKTAIDNAIANWFVEVDIDASHKALKLHTDYVGLFAEGWISAGGIGSGSGSGGGTSVQWGTYDSGYRELVVENDPDMSDVSHRTVALSGHTHSQSDITGLGNTISQLESTIQSGLNALDTNKANKSLTISKDTDASIAFNGDDSAASVTLANNFSIGISATYKSKIATGEKAWAFLDALFEAKDSSGNTITTVAGLANLASIKAKKGLWTEFFLSAGGIGSGGSAGSAVSWTQEALTGISTVKIATIRINGADTNVYAPSGEVTSVAGYKGAVTVAQLQSALGGSVASGNTGFVTGGQVWAAIDNLPEPMIFKGSLGTGGTITTLPAASGANEGWTYKVITAGTYASQAAQIGDLFISNGSAWVWIPSGDEPTGTVTSVGLSMPTGFSVSSSPVTSSGTLTVAFATGYSLLTSTQATAWNAKYDKPSTGIPYNDLSSGVRASLDLADTAIQDISGKADKANISAGTAGTNQPTSGATIAIPYLTMTAQGIVSGYGTHSHSISKSDLGLGSVENTALSTWAGSTNITTLGTIATGVWNGTPIANAFLANSAITINGTSTSLGGSFNTASITGGTAGTSASTSGATIAIPYVTVNNYGIVTAYGTHSHSISKSDIGLGNVDNTADANKSVASAAQLTTARSIWGQSFNGSADVSGAMSSVTTINDMVHLQTSSYPDGTLKIFTVDGGYDCGPETVVLQTSFDNTDPGTSSYPVDYPRRCFLSLQPRGGVVGIGYTTSQSIFDGILADYKLGVEGSVRVGGSVMLAGSTKRIYFGSQYIELDSNGYFHFSSGLYSDGFVSAGGIGTGGGGGGSAVAWKYGTAGRTYDVLVINGTDTYNVALAGHTHTASEISDLSTYYYNKSSVDSLLASKANSSDLSGYVPKNGSSTITGTLSLANASTGLCTLHYRTNDTYRGCVAYEDGGYGLYLQLASGAYVNLASDGVFKYGNQYPFLHSNNFSSYAIPLTGGVTYSQVSEPQNAGDQRGEETPSDGVTWARTNALAHKHSLTYNSYGTEWAYLNAINNNDGRFGAIFKFGYNGAYLMSLYGGTWGNWREFAFIDSNVASATYATSAGDANTLDGQHGSYYVNTSNIGAYALNYNGWWNSEDTHNVDDATGMLFAYTTHGVPEKWGVVSTFSHTLGTSYQLQLHGAAGTSNHLWFRNNSGDYGKGTWKRVLTADELSTMSVNYATSAGDANYANYLTQIISSDEDTAMPGSGKFAVYHMTTSTAPGAAGHIMAFNWGGDVYGAQIYIDTDPSGYMSFRQRDGNGTWTSWYQILHSVNYSSYALPLTGGRITGATTYTTNSGGSTTIDKVLDALVIGPGVSRAGGAGTYYPGIGFNHMLRYNNANTYDYTTHAWIGLRLYDTPGSERSCLVFATKEGSGTTESERPIERMCIDPFGNVGIGTTSPSEKLTVSGYVSASGYKVDGLSSPGSYLLLANGSTTATSTFVWNSDIESNWQNIDSSSYSAKVPDCGALSSYISDKLAGYIPILTNHNNYVATFNTSGTLSAVYQTSGSAADINTGATTLLACASDVYDFVTGWVTSTNKTHWETAYSWVNSYGYSDYARTSQANTFTATQNVQSVIPTSDNTYDLGSSSYRWSYIHGDYYYANRIISNNSSDYLLRFYAGSNSTLAFQVADTWSQFFGSISPGSNATYDLGSSSVRWSAAYVNNVQSQNLYATQSAYIGASIYFTDYSCAFQGKTGSSSYSSFFRIYTDSSNWQGDVNVGIMPDSGYSATHELNLYGSDLNFRTGNYSDTGTTKMTISSSAIHCYVGLYSDDYISAGGIGSSSDLRLKTNLREVKLTVADIAEAPAVEFEWVKNFKTGAGSVAQYWQKYLPHNVIADANGLLTMEYGNIALLSAITIARKVESNTEKIARLEARVKELENQLYNN